MPTKVVSLIDLSGDRNEHNPPINKLATQVRVAVYFGVFSIIY